MLFLVPFNFIVGGMDGVGVGKKCPPASLLMTPSCVLLYEGTHWRDKIPSGEPLTGLRGGPV